MPQIPGEQISPYGPRKAARSKPSDQSTTTISPPPRQGDRDGGDDGTACFLPIYVRFRDIKAANIARNWPTLGRLIAEDNFPPGVMLGRNIRAWKLADVEAWLASRPVERKVVPNRWDQRATGT